MKILFTMIGALLVGMSLSVGLDLSPIWSGCLCGGLTMLFANISY